jgi:uncharacterized membrane protein
VSISWGRRLLYAAVAVVIVAYTVLAHYSNAVQARDLGAGLALAPVITIGLILAWRWTAPLLALLLAVAFAALLYRYWPVLAKHFTWVYLLQDCGFNVLLAAGFGRSLFAGRVAFCTQLADRLHGPLTAREVLYTRRVTAAWALFFALIGAVTVGLFLWAPRNYWSLFANFCTLPLVGVMFAAEYAIRRRVLPQVRSVGIIATVRVYLARSY